MKVLILQSELGVLRGGGENFTKNLFASFAQRGHRVVAAFVADRSGRYPISLPASIEPVPVPGWWSRNFGQATISSIGQWHPFRNRFRSKWERLQESLSWRAIRWHDLRFKRHVERRFERVWTDFDAVYVHGNIDLASQVSKFRPTVLRLPGPVTPDTETLLRTVQAVCANGDALVRIRRFLGDHAVELPIGIDAVLFKPGTTSVRSALNWTKEHHVVGYVGRLTRLKGVDLISSAFRVVLKKHPNFRLLIIGAGEEEKNIRSYLAKEIAFGSVHIEPDVDHDRLGDWYRAMDLLVMPSRYENFSNTLLEGMACGIPFLASDVGGNAAMVESGAGWLFEADSVSSLTQKLQCLLDDSAALEQRGRLGLLYMRNHHSWSVSAERLEQIMNRLIGEK